MLLHGFTGAAESWGDELLSALATGGRDVVPLDLPGHGRAPHPPPDPRTALDDAVRRVVDAVSGPFDLLGYSMGGRIALHVALRHPDRVRRLVLESASPGLAAAAERAARRAADEALAARIEEQGIELFVAEWATVDVLRPGPRRDPAASRRADRVRRTHRAPGLAAALRGLGTGSLPSLWDRLGDVRPPTRLVTGALDAKFGEIARRMAGAMTDAVVDAVPDAGHTVHLDRPDAWLSLVRSWLDGRPG